MVGRRRLNCAPGPRPSVGDRLGEDRRLWNLGEDRRAAIRVLACRSRSPRHFVSEGVGKFDG